MELIETVPEMRSYAASTRGGGDTLALVPTMGGLHAGHLRLVERASELADRTVVSLYVNPTQFGPGEDFEAYPRDVAGDRRLLERQGLAHALFAPSDREMYPSWPPLTSVTLSGLTETLCGASRPGHFRGVTTVVAKLFNICAPDVAVFGLKDVQQYFIIRRMVDDLNMNVSIDGVATVREKDGLALSSRNRYLTPEERSQSPALYRSVLRARDLIASGETDADVVREAMQRELRKASLGRLDYAEVVSASDFQPLSLIPDNETIVAAVAMYFGKARLIDNAIVER